MDILVSYYNNESYIDLIEKFKKCSYNASINYFIYNKSNEIIYNTYKLKNIGREADTYLHHIIENYNNLNEYTLFLQDDVDNHILDNDKFINLCLQNIKDDIDFKIFDVQWRKNYKPISRTIVNGILNLHTLPSETSIKDMCNYMNIEVPHIYTTETCAFMMVHKNLIKKYPKNFYIKLREWLLLDDKNAFVLEHCWKILFGKKVKKTIKIT